MTDFILDPGQCPEGASFYPTPLSAHGLMWAVVPISQPHTKSVTERPRLPTKSAARQCLSKRPAAWEAWPLHGLCYFPQLDPVFPCSRAGLYQALKELHLELSEDCN